MSHGTFTPATPNASIEFTYRDTGAATPCAYTFRLFLRAEFMQGGTVVGGVVSGEPLGFLCSPYPHFTFNALAAEWISSED